MINVFPLQTVMPLDVAIRAMPQRCGTIAVFKIKGAPCTLCAHFGCRVHRFFEHVHQVGACIF